MDLHWCFYPVISVKKTNRVVVNCLELKREMKGGAKIHAHGRHTTTQEERVGGALVLTLFDYPMHAHQLQPIIMQSKCMQPAQSGGKLFQTSHQ